jgi:ribosomal protein S18 acetylase RimI-like enzyme
MEDIIIRKVKLQDIPAVVDISISGWQNAYQGIIDDNYLKSLDAERAKKIAKMEKSYDSSGFIVAEIDNQIVGFCRYIDNNSFSKQIEDADCELSVMYVKPNMKRSGIGSKLFFYVLNEFYKKDKELMVIWCLKENQPAINFYQKKGGTIISEKVKEHGGKENKEICFGYNIKELIKSRKI